MNRRSPSTADQNFILDLQWNFLENRRKPLLDNEENPKRKETGALIQVHLSGNIIPYGCSHAHISSPLVPFYVICALPP